MNWNIFKRIAELEARVAALSLQIIQHGLDIEDLQDEQAEDDQIYQATVDVMSAEIAKKSTLTEAQKKERILESKRNYYQRNKDKLAEQRRKKYQDERRKLKAREYAKRYYAKKKAVAQAKLEEQQRFFMSA